MQELPIVFAPGLMCDANLFEPQLRKFAPERPFMVADFSQDDTVESMARRLLEGAPERFILAGLSMGGIVAFEVLRQAPQRVAGLVLLNTTPFSVSPARKKERLSQIDRVNNGALKTVVMEELKPNYLGAKTKQDKQLLNIIYGMAESLGPEVFERQCHATMRHPDSTETCASISCPTLIICGDEDEICPPDFHEIMQAAIPGSILKVLPECGHLSTLEAPEAVNDLIDDFVCGVDATTTKEKIYANQ